MKIKVLTACIICLILLSVSNVAEAAGELTGITFVSQGEEATVDINLSPPHNYNTFTLSDPERIVIDFYDTVDVWGKKEMLLTHGLVRSIRSSQYEDSPKKISRVVIDLKKPADYRAISQKDKLTFRVLPKGGKILPPVKAPSKKLVSLDFKDTDIKTVIKAISELTQKNFVVDEKVRGKVTIISPVKISVDEVYAVLESILEVKGYTAIPAGEVIKIVSAREAKGKSVETKVGKGVEKVSREDKIITQIIPLEYAICEQVQSLFAPLISPGGNLITYAPTNTVIVTDVSSNIRRMMTIVEEIDRKPPPGQEMIHVYYLQNSEAENIAKILTDLYAKVPSRNARGGRNLAQEEKPTVVSDKLTNSLIIIAAPGVYDELEEIIKKLDIPLQKVLVEAMVAEVSLDKLLNLGVEWAIVDDLRPGKTHQPFAATDFGMQPDLLAGTLYGMSLGMFKDEATNIGALVNLYVTDSDVNILSTPYLLTNNNQEAEIKVGKRVPMVTASRLTEDETVVKTYTYEDVGIVLKITPQINPEGFVTLKIHQELQKVLEETIHDAPVVASREADTTVTVKDGQTVVIGGLLRDDKAVVNRRIPGLGRIPLLGWLFKRKVETTEKISLVIFLSPHVVTTPEEVDQASKRKIAEIEDFTGRVIEK
jgi:general secretion pathway protein D